MNFHSIEFILFLVVVYLWYGALNFRRQNLLLLVASYSFYAVWDWRFLSLIWLSTLVDFYCGKKIAQSSHDPVRKRFLCTSLIVNLGVLGIFKYFNFFAGSLQHVFSFLGVSLHWTTLEIVLPVGISFYTFQTLSYTIDIYRRQMRPTSNLLEFAVFVAFFPQLVAGPIERAKRLLPQFAKPRVVSAAIFSQGLWWILLGYFQKIVVADRCARLSTPVFQNPETVVGMGAFIGVVAFSIQIYADFAGYSNIARGVAKLMGIDLMENFKRPYFAIHPSDFWKRWHVSLSTWIRDYVYIPLGGNRLGNTRTVINLLLTMGLAGLWHGARWNFVVWGLYHGMLLVGHRIVKKNFSLPLPRLAKSLLCLAFILFGWLLFGIRELNDAAVLLNSLSWTENWYEFRSLVFVMVLCIPWFIVDLCEEKKWRFYYPPSMPRWQQAGVYVGVYLCILLFGVISQREFIYFQF